MTILQPRSGAGVGDLPEGVGGATGADAFWERLADFGAAPALRSSDEVVTYAELAGRVGTMRARLGATRRLVVLAARNDAETVVGYLGCLAGGHPVLLTAPERAAALANAYDADVVLDGFLAGGLHDRRRGSAHRLHPELAQLASTSGSTGSPKLVRLSATAVASNADVIASYLDLRASDVGVTTLPLHYCYGLSVLASHLAVGASLLLTDRSVLDEALWEEMAAARVSTIPGVPHTFELLERVGFDASSLPSLRALTQAGGRMDPERVRRFAELGLAHGFDLFVMYGATEATARMAYLPPELATSRPGTVGVAVPGGRFELDGVGPDGVGELVYFGDNVMLGYATSPADLALGREVDRLHTGDLARFDDAGLVEIVGREGRFAKVFGLRLDLDQIERSLAEQGILGFAADRGDRVLVAVDSSAAPVEEGDVRAALDLPAAAVEVVAVSGVPRLPNGKPDYAALAAMPAAAAEHGRTDLAALFAEVLRSDEVTGHSSFVSLGGDSLSYVEMSLRLEAELGTLPADWHRRSISALERIRLPEVGGSTRGDRRRIGVRTVETNVLLRALAIVLIVGSHADLFTVMGGAHVLLGLAGYNYARFRLTGRPRAERLRGSLVSIARIAVPSVLWIGFAALISVDYDWRSVVLLNGVLGRRGWSDAWHYWFIEAIVWTLLGVALLVAVPVIDRFERRRPFLLPVLLALAGLLTRYDVVRVFGGVYIYRAHVVFWLFALGWAAAKATRARERWLVSVILVVTVFGFFDGAPSFEHVPTQHGREALIVVGLLLLVWVPTLRVPTPVASAAGVLASSSLYVYLCHWQIYPYWERTLPWLATTLSFAGGIVLWRVVLHLTPYAERLVRGWSAADFGNRRQSAMVEPPEVAVREDLVAPAQGAR